MRWRWEPVTLSAVESIYSDELRRRARSRGAIDSTAQGRLEETVELLTLRKVAGACAVIYTIIIVATLILAATVDLLDAEDAVEFLPIMDDEQTAAGLVSWAFVVAPILLAVVGLGLFSALRQSSPTMWIALLTFSGGSLLIVFRGSIFVAATYELAPAYVAASGDAQTTLAAVGDTLFMFAYTADIIGAALIGGIGVPLFSWAILRTKITSKWIAWLGFFSAIFGGWLFLFAPLAQAIEDISSIGGITWFIWTIAIGVVLWRTPEADSA